VSACTRSQEPTTRIEVAGTPVRSPVIKSKPQRGCEFRSVTDPFITKAYQWTAIKSQRKCNRLTPAKPKGLCSFNICANCEVSRAIVGATMTKSPPITSCPRLRSCSELPGEDQYASPHRLHERNSNPAYYRCGEFQASRQARGRASAFFGLPANCEAGHRSPIRVVIFIPALQLPEVRRQRSYSG